MRSVLVVAVAVACGVGLAGAAHAQQSPLSYEALAHSKPGQWAEYTMTMKSTDQTMKMKYAIVEKSDKTLALEIDSQTPMGPMLMHMAFAEAAPQTWKVVKARMQMGDHTQDIPQEQLADGVIKKNDAPGKLIGTESVKTVLGTLSCKHYQRVLPKDVPGGGSTVDVWMSDRVLPTGMVKMSNSMGVEILLSSTGKDAKARMSLTGPAQPAASPAGGAAPPAAAGAAPAAKPAGGSSTAAPAKK